jgi:hypothetical protein
LAWAGAIVLAIVVLAVVASFFIDEPLRRHVEYQMNQRLDGYTVRIGRLDFHPLGFSIDFEDLLLTQNAHPDPPVSRIGRITAGVHWRALIRGRLVADFEMVRPTFYVDLTHVRREAADDRPVDKRGWQDALEAMYPLKINQFRVREGEFTYVDEGPFKPLRVTQVDALATNIRNIRSRDRVYPSELTLHGVAFGAGRIKLDGRADFLAEPHLGILAVVQLEGIELDHFKPILARYHLALRKGTLSARGDLEYAPKIKAVHLHEAVLRDIEGDYIHSAPAAEQVKRGTEKAARTAEEATNRPDLQLRIDRFRVVKGNLGFTNATSGREYRAFLSDIDLQVENVSNHFTAGTGQARLTGKFMGSGATVATGTFRPELSGPDFDLNVSIENTQMPTMNDMLRAHGRFDVVAGLFSFYSELHVKNDQISGYVKPLFRNLDVYDREQDREKRLLQKVYERLVGGLAKLLENPPRDQVATKAEIAGQVQNPRASTWEVVVRLVQNAFFKAILPGFEREVRRGRR